jgi:hypothetical protein
LCLNVVVDARIAQARTLSGPEVPSPLTVRLWIHADPLPGLPVVMAVRMNKAGAGWTGSLVHIALPGRQACVDPERLAALEVEMPSGRRTRDGQLCFPVPMDPT